MKVLIVDDEKMAAQELYDICLSHRLTDEAIAFGNPADALVFMAQKNQVDLAFLDIEMPVMTGIELARRINAVNPETKIVFVTGFKEYAYDAFCVNAIGYILKPYEEEAVFAAIEKAARFSDAQPHNEITVKTFGHFDIFVNGRPVYFSSAKAKEFSALLIERQGGSVSTEQAISALWPDRSYDEAVQALFRKVLKSLRVSLSDAGISEIFIDVRNQRSVDTSKFTCDLYEYLKNPYENGGMFSGEYMEGYAFAFDMKNRLQKLSNETKGEK